MWVVSGLFPGILWRKWGHSTCYLQLDLISALYTVYVPVMWGYFTGILPFMGILQVISGTPLLQEYRQNILSED